MLLGFNFLLKHRHIKRHTAYCQIKAVAEHSNDVFRKFNINNLEFSCLVRMIRCQAISILLIPMSIDYGIHNWMFNLLEIGNKIEMTVAFEFINYPVPLKPLSSFPQLPSWAFQVTSCDQRWRHLIT